MPLAAGTKLDGYEVLGLLGAGGMGEVYRARDPALKREVAIKVLPSFVSRDPDRLHRFEQEAQAAAALNHPNILAVYQFGVFEGAPYLVSELLVGESLRQVLQRGPLPVRKAIDYAVQIAHGLAAAHDHGIVHRDLKPENLFVTKDGRIKILDFGLAKIMQPQLDLDSDGAAPTLTARTNPGVVMGTAGYMSPEQVRGKPVDHRTDIFAFGAILYEMLTGTRAFHRSTSAETMTAILNDDPPGISQIATTIPPGLQRVVHRCLEKNPEQRFHSASDLAFALEALTDPSGATEHAGFGGRSLVSRWVRWVVPSALVLAAVLIGLYLRRSSSDKSSGPPPLDIRALTESGNAIRVAATPDGRYVAYVNRDAGKFELRLLQVATGRDVQVFPGSPREIVNLHFSADGNFIYFLRQLDPSGNSLGVFRIATLGGPVTPLAADARMNSVTVSPDGKHIAYIAQTPSESQIISIDSDGTNRHVIAKRPLRKASGSSSGRPCQILWPR